MRPVLTSSMISMISTIERLRSWKELQVEDTASLADITREAGKSFGFRRFNFWLLMYLFLLLFLWFLSL